MMLFRVARHIFEINVVEPCTSWAALSWHFSPFKVSEGTPGLHIEVCRGAIDASGRKGMTLMHHDQAVEADSLVLDAYNSDHEWLFEVTQPRSKAPNGSLLIDKDFTLGIVKIDEGSDARPKWQAVTSLTSMLQLAYMLSTNSQSTILTHASSVIKDGRAYLFIAKSGTGKSTHSQLWLKNVPDTVLLNDDHPILRIDDDGTVRAYGSPWSGKTDCYKDMDAPVGAIVRIKRAPFNAIERLAPVQAYASLITSFSGLTIDRTQADDRHATIESIVSHVPCYVLSCLPDDEAARVCSAEVLK